MAELVAYIDEAIGSSPIPPTEKNEHYIQMRRYNQGRGVEAGNLAR